MKNDGGKVFPIWDENGDFIVKGWITLRDYFASAALQAILSYSGPDATPRSPDRAAEWAYEYSDAMLKEREKK
jgi:hypothetical protein